MMYSVVLLCTLESWFVGICSSIIGAIFVVFFLFFFFRPKIEIGKEIAIRDDKTLELCVKNKSMCTLVNIRAYLKEVKVENNADENERKIPLKVDDRAFLCSRFKKENESELGFFTKEPIQEIPSRLRLIVSSQHSISGLTAVTTRDFVSSNARQGSFQKGLFIPKGSDYARVYSQRCLQKGKITFWLLSIAVIGSTIAFGIFTSHVWWHIIACFAILASCSLLIMLFMYCHAQAKVSAFSSRLIFQEMNLLQITFNKIASNQLRTEEVEGTEVK